MSRDDAATLSPSPMSSLTPCNLFSCPHFRTQSPISRLSAAETERDRIEIGTLHRLHGCRRGRVGNQAGHARPAGQSTSTGLCCAAGRPVWTGLRGLLSWSDLVLVMGGGAPWRRHLEGRRETPESRQQV